jgi:hypothetical protein
MSWTLFGILFDAALMAMLAVAIYFGIRLNRQMASIREGRKEFEGLIRDFTGATDRAERALADLRAEVDDKLGEARQSAQKSAELCDDLEFLIKRGEKVADALEIGIRAGRKAEAGMGAGGEVSEAPVRAGKGRAESERAASRALSVSPEDRPLGGSQDQGASDASGRRKAKAKSKSELLKALQDMR